MRVVKDDIFNSTAPAMCHGVNCRGFMGAGLAKPMREKFPMMYENYKELCEQGKLLPGMVYAYYDASRKIVIYNLASQDNPGPNARMDWLKEAVLKMLDHAAANDIPSIAVPKIGAGIGGLDWQEVKAMLFEAQSEYPEVEMVVYDYDK